MNTIQKVSINTKKCDPNKIKKDEISNKNILIYYIGYMTVKDWKYLRINSVKTSLPYYQQSKWIL